MRGILTGLGLEIAAWQVWTHASWVFWVCLTYVVLYSFYVVIDWYVCLCRNSRAIREPEQRQRERRLQLIVGSSVKTKNEWRREWTA